MADFLSKNSAFFLVGDSGRCGLALEARRRGSGQATAWELGEDLPLFSFVFYEEYI